MYSKTDFSHQVCSFPSKRIIPCNVAFTFKTERLKHTHFETCIKKGLPILENYPNPKPLIFKYFYSIVQYF